MVPFRARTILDQVSDDPRAGGFPPVNSALRASQQRRGLGGWVRLAGAGPSTHGRAQRAQTAPSSGLIVPACLTIVQGRLKQLELMLVFGTRRGVLTPSVRVPLLASSPAEIQGSPEPMREQGLRACRRCGFLRVDGSRWGRKVSAGCAVRTAGGRSRTARSRTAGSGRRRQLRPGGGR